MTPSVVIKAGFKNTKCTGPYKTRTKKSNNKQQQQNCTQYTKDAHKTLLMEKPGTNNGLID